MFVLLSFLTMIGLLLIGVPVVFSISIISLYYLWINHIPLLTLAQRMTTGVDSFPLMAAPLFMLAGTIMSSGGSTKRLVDLSNAAVGHLRGGLGHVNVVASMIFAGMSGSATADAAGLGTVELKMMTDSGYDKGFSAALTAASSTIGPIIPPSVPFVIYGAFTQVSVGRLFLGGAIPGLFMGLFSMAAVYLVARKRNYPKNQAFSAKSLFTSFRRAFLELLTPLIIVGGIIGGIFTPTEAATVAIVYALVIEVVVRREIKLSQLPDIFIEACKFTGVIMFIIAAAATYSWILMREQAGPQIVDLLSSITESEVVITLIILAVLVILGCFIETISCIIISVPIVVPLANHIGMDPVHLGVVVVLAVMIGMITPPVGLCMYVICAIADIDIMEFVKNIFPFFLALLIVLVIVAFFPSLSSFLPNLIMD